MKIVNDRVLQAFVNIINDLFAKKSEVNNTTSAIKGKMNATESAVLSLSGMVVTPDFYTLPLLCGQPMILFGEGTPQESVVPKNWKQYDAMTDEGYNWNGKPSAIGQQYINLSASTNGRYIAVDKENGTLIWENF